MYPLTNIQLLNILKIKFRIVHRTLLSLDGRSTLKFLSHFTMPIFP